MAGIGVVVNPYARGNKRKPNRAGRLQTLLGEDGLVVATRNFDELDATLRRFREIGIDILAVCGGDGSFYHVVTRALTIWGDDKLPLLLPLRGGTINNLARTIGSRRRRPEDSG